MFLESDLISKQTFHTRVLFSLQVEAVAVRVILDCFFRKRFGYIFNIWRQMLLKVDYVWLLCFLQMTIGSFFFTLQFKIREVKYFRCTFSTIKKISLAWDLAWGLVPAACEFGVKMCRYFADHWLNNFSMTSCFVQNQFVISVKFIKFLKL